MAYIYGKIKQIRLPFFRSSSNASKNADKLIAPSDFWEWSWLTYFQVLSVLQDGEGPLNQIPVGSPPPHPGA